MPLTALNFDAAVGWTQTGVNANFSPPTETNAQAFAAEASLPSSGSVSFWNQANAQALTLNPGGTGTVDCYVFTNLAGGAVTATAAMGIAVFPVGGDVTVAPGASNPLYWFFNGASTATTAGITAPNNGFLAYCKPGSDTGTTAINATTRNLLFTNGSGSNTTTVTICLIEAGNNA